MKIEQLTEDQRQQVIDWLEDTKEGWDRLEGTTSMDSPRMREFRDSFFDFRSSVVDGGDITKAYKQWAKGIDIDAAYDSDHVNAPQWGFAYLWRNLQTAPAL